MPNEYDPYDLFGVTKQIETPHQSEYDPYDLFGVTKQTSKQNEYDPYDLFGVKQSKGYEPYKPMVEHVELNKPLIPAQQTKENIEAEKYMATTTPMEYVAKAGQSTLAGTTSAAIGLVDFFNKLYKVTNPTSYMKPQFEAVAKEKGYSDEWIQENWKKVNETFLDKPVNDVKEFAGGLRKAGLDGIAGMVFEGLGRLPIDIPKYATLGFVAPMMVEGGVEGASQALEEGKNPVWGGVKGAAIGGTQGYITKKLMGITQYLPKGTQHLGAGVLGGAVPEAGMQLLQGEDITKPENLKRIIASTITMGLIHQKTKAPVEKFSLKDIFAKDIDFIKRITKKDIAVPEENHFTIDELASAINDYVAKPEQAKAKEIPTEQVTETDVIPPIPQMKPSDKFKPIKLIDENIMLDPMTDKPNKVFRDWQNDIKATTEQGVLPDGTPYTSFQEIKRPGTRGAGTHMYESLIEDVINRGGIFKADAIASSPDSLRVMEKIANKKGYNMSQIGLNLAGQPRYQISKWETTQPKNIQIESVNGEPSATPPVTPPITPPPGGTGVPGETIPAMKEPPKRDISQYRTNTLERMGGVAAELPKEPFEKDIHTAKMDEQEANRRYDEFGKEAVINEIVKNGVGDHVDIKIGMDEIQRRNKDLSPENIQEIQRLAVALSSGISEAGRDLRVLRNYTGSLAENVIVAQKIFDKFTEQNNMRGKMGKIKAEADKIDTLKEDIIKEQQRVIQDEIVKEPSPIETDVAAEKIKKFVDNVSKEVAKETQAREPGQVKEKEAKTPEEILANKIATTVKPPRKKVAKDIEVSNLVKTLFDKVKTWLPEKSGVKKPVDELDLIANYIKDPGKYKAVYDKAKGLIAEKMDKLGIKGIDKLFDIYMETQPEAAWRKYFPEKYAEKGVNRLLAEKGININKIAFEHFSKQKSTLADLVQELKRYGLNDEQAAQMANMVEGKFSDKINARKQKFIESLLPKEIQGQPRQDVIDKLVKLSNAGALDVAQTREIISNTLNINRFLSEKQIDINAIVKGYYQNQSKQKIGEYVANEIKTRHPELTGPEIENIRNIFESRIEKRLDQVKANAINRFLAVNKKSPTRQSILQLINETNNLGLLSKAEIQNGLKQRLGLPTLDEATVKMIQDYSNRIQKLPQDSIIRMIVEGQLFRDINRKVPGSLKDKIVLFQKMSLLLRPKSPIKNLVGNTLYEGITRIVNKMAVPVDMLFALRNKGRTIAWGTGNELKQSWIKTWIRETTTDFHMAIQGLDINNKLLMSKAKNIFNGSVSDKELNEIFKFQGVDAVGGKYETGPSQLYTSRAGKIATAMLAITMRSPDRGAFWGRFENSLANQIVAHKLNKGYEGVTPGMFEQAISEGLQVTFQNKTIATWLTTRVKRVFHDAHPILGIVAESQAPFLKTPLNITNTVIEHSPLGFMKAIINTIRVLSAGKDISTRTGKKESHQAEYGSLQRQTALLWARASFGTVPIILAGIFAKHGALTGGETDQEIKDLNVATGKGNGTVNITAAYRYPASGFDPSVLIARPGDHFVDLDFSGPIGMGFLLGAKMYHLANTPSSKLTAGQRMLKAGGTILEMYLSAADMIAETPMGQGFKAIAGGKSVADTLATAIKSVPAQYIPQILADIALSRTGDLKDVRDDNPANMAWNMIQKRLPYIADKLPTRVNVLGQKMNIYEPNSTAFESFVNVLGFFCKPWITKKYNASPEIQFLEMLYRKTGDEKILPKNVTGGSAKVKSFTYNGQKIVLTQEDRLRLQELNGQMFSLWIKENFDSIKSMEKPEDQAEIIYQIIADASKEAKEKWLIEKGF